MYLGVVWFIASFQLYTLSYFLHYLIKVARDGLQEFYREPNTSGAY